MTAYTRQFDNAPSAPAAPVRPMVWAIGGSDSGGGAGIQADVLTLTDLGCHACTVITAVTAQNSQQVTLVSPVDCHTLLAQLTTLSTDLPPRVVKIGQIPAPAQAEVLLQWLAEHKQQLGFTLIWDPVLIATAGQQLSDLGRPLCLRLLALVDILTPNWQELAMLTASSEVRLQQILAEATSTAGPQLAATFAKLLPNFGGHLLLKGGHAPNPQATVQDLLLSCKPQQPQLITLQAPRLQTQHQHGTGCTLASALAAVLAHGYELNDALVVARAYLQQGLRLSYATGQGPGVLTRAGWPNQPLDFPRLLAQPQAQAQTVVQQLSFAKLTHPLGLYPVVDDIQWLKRLLPLGLHTIQLRLKNLSQPELERQISQAVAYCRDFDMQLFINDHWQLAIEYQAFGVHLGQEDIATADLAAIAAAGLRLGISTHGYAELCQVLALQPSYLALGHIFPTNTKQMPSKPQGVARLAQYVRLCDRTPTVAIGGIQLADIPALLATGVQGIAVVSAITKAAEPEKALLQLKQACQRGSVFAGEPYASH